MGNERHWVGTWAATPAPSEVGVGFNNHTLRLNPRISIGGDTLQVRISNAYGARKLDIGAAYIGIRESGPAVVAGSERKLTFNGSDKATIAAGALMVSDPVKLEVKPLADLLGRPGEEARVLADRRVRLGGVCGATATTLCGIPFAVGFLLPAGLLLRMAIGEGGAQFGARFVQLAANSVTLAALTSALLVALALLMAYNARLHPGLFSVNLNRLAGLGYAVPGLVIAVGVPLTVVTLPFVPPFGVLGVIVAYILVLAAAFWRTASNLDAHTRAGAELVVHVLGKQARTGDTGMFEVVRGMLPGLGTIVPLQVEQGSEAAGKTLGELNLRGRSGATVVAVSRGNQQNPAPTARTRLEPGDLVALTGNERAVGLAAALLRATDTSSPRSGTDASARPDG